MNTNRFAVLAYDSSDSDNDTEVKPVEHDDYEDMPEENYIRDYEELLMPFRTMKMGCRPFIPNPHKNPNPERGNAYFANPKNWTIEWKLVSNPSEWDWERYTGRDHHGVRLNYGKYKGMTYEEIVQEDVGYAVWLVNKAKRMTEEDRCYMGWLIWMSQNPRGQDVPSSSSGAGDRGV